MGGGGQVVSFKGKLVHLAKSFYFALYERDRVTGFVCNGLKYCVVCICTELVEKFTVFS